MIRHLAVTPLALAVITAVPFFLAVTTPEEETEATDFLLEIQVTF